MTSSTTAPYITVAGTAYALDQLNDRLRMLSSDLLRTVQEYQSVLANYRQSITLTSAYTGGLKNEVEKLDLPIAFAPQSDKPEIKIGDVRYDASDLPESVKAYVAELFRVNEQKTGIEFRLRQLDAARNAYVDAIRKEIEDTKPEPMNPQPV